MVQKITRDFFQQIMLLFLDGRYCHAVCKEGYFPPAGYETISKMTKLTCQCNEDESSCEWVPDKPFIGCVGPCEQPIRSFENLSMFFKASFRKKSTIFDTKMIFEN